MGYTFDVPGMVVGMLGGLVLNYLAFAFVHHSKIVYLLRALPSWFIGGFLTFLIFRIWADRSK